MKRIRLKTTINQLVKAYNGDQQKLADDLGISLRLVQYLKKGERLASVHLAEYAKRLLEEKAS